MRDVAYWPSTFIKELEQAKPADGVLLHALGGPSFLYQSPETSIWIDPYFYGTPDDAVPDADVLREHRARGEEELGRGAMRVLLEEVVLDRPDLVEAQLVRQLHLLERIVVDGALRLTRPGARDRQLVEESEFHGRLLWRIRCSMSRVEAGGQAAKCIAAPACNGSR